MSVRALVSIDQDATLGAAIGGWPLVVTRGESGWEIAFMPIESEGLSLRVASNQ